MMEHTPGIVQIVPHENHTVTVYFCDGKSVLYDVKPKLGRGVFQQLTDLSFFMERCTILNDTLAWVPGRGMRPIASISIRICCISWGRSTVQAQLERHIKGSQPFLSPLRGGWPCFMP